ncbi:class I SAM-dependent methyltransferase [Pseudidiomarina sediminum]|uniref:class I SAM-dependent methyltransferase n=1 Tax=Pseudidiomarina sediminum TaxID=431675 RepID=UPI001C96A205|nr:methyltransferase domain-containing protein [Pseudidiomarina sediminum]MBY6063639.1 class I SAM-dependent methyltransferase [Pseudidiomarina sediminum]
MAKSYQEHFNQRGTAYEQAMRSYPNARAEEFQQVITAAQLNSGMTVADVPAGGGYLRRYLPNDCQWLGHEPCASFTHHQTSAATAQPLLPLPWATAHIDAAISLAGVHHLDDKLPLFHELFRVLKPGARLVLSDVEEHSAVARFLDDYIGAHNSTGHEGVYLNAATLTQLKSCGFHIINHQHCAFHWWFDSTNDMAHFSHKLFDLRTANLQHLEQAIHDYLGPPALTTQQVGMPWALTTITALKP